MKYYEKSKAKSTTIETSNAINHLNTSAVWTDTAPRGFLHGLPEHSPPPHPTWIKPQQSYVQRGDQSAPGRQGQPDWHCEGPSKEWCDSASQILGRWWMMMDWWQLLTWPTLLESYDQPMNPSLPLLSSAIRMIKFDVITLQDDQTALHVASRLGSVDNVVLLLRHGASPDDMTKDQSTPLHLAAREGHLEVVQVLLDHGAKKEMMNKVMAENWCRWRLTTWWWSLSFFPQQSQKGFTALHLACKQNHSDIVEALLGRGCNCDQTSTSGLTPLHVCAHYDRPSIASLLLQHDAKIAIPAKVSTGWRWWMSCAGWWFAL